MTDASAIAATSEWTNGAHEVQERLLPCPMTPAELAQIADEQDELHARIAELEAEKRSMTADLSAQIKRARAQLDRLWRQRRSRQIERPVACTITRDLRRGIERVTRHDTGEQVGEPRELSKQEIAELSQTRLPGCEEDERDVWRETGASNDVWLLVDAIREAAKAGGDRLIAAHVLTSTIEALVRHARTKLPQDAEQEIRKAATQELRERAKHDTRAALGAEQASEVE